MGGLLVGVVPAVGPHSEGVQGYILVGTERVGSRGCWWGGCLLLAHMVSMAVKVTALGTTPLACISSNSPCTFASLTGSLLLSYPY